MSSSKKVTIQDIAQKADVSISTVSRVLNGRVSVAEPKRSAVLKAVDDLGYRPNVFAQSLASGHSMTIGILTQEIRNAFYDAMLHYTIQEINDSRYSAIIADGHWQDERGLKALNTLINRQVDGLILIGGSLPEAPIVQVSQRLPLVIAGRFVPSLAKQCVYVDNFAGGFEATTHLIELGHRRIAHIAGDPTHEDAIARTNGYKAALEKAGLPLDSELIIEGNFMPQSGLLGVEMLLTRGRMFTAVFSSNDNMAYGARLALFRHGIRVPEDVSIIGFDDVSMSAYTVPPLTTMKQPAQELGQAAAQMIFKMIKCEPFEIRPFQAQLMLRESTAPNR